MKLITLVTETYLFSVKSSSQQTKICSLMENSSASGKAYLNTNREEGKWVFIAYMLNSVEQQMIGIENYKTRLTKYLYWIKHHKQN